MKNYELLKTANKREIAYVRNYCKDGAQRAGVLFLGGFLSDMEGTKACFLENWCAEKQVNYVKFDYSGHGSSSGSFEDGCITDWVNDACEVLDNITNGKQIIVGSSMGGWIAFLLAKIRPQRFFALVGIAAAPDFTENSMWSGFSEKQRANIQQYGKVLVPSNYSDEPYPITKKLIEDGRRNLILKNPINLSFPVRLLQGMEDQDVAFSEAINLTQHISCRDLRTVLVKHADHQFSNADCLSILANTLDELL